MRARAAAIKAEAAATALQTWMRAREDGRTVGSGLLGAPAPDANPDDVVRPTPPSPNASASATLPEQPAARDPDDLAVLEGEALAAVRHAGPSLAPAHTDWLYHRLCITGPAAVLDQFRTAARGPGAIDWHLDLDRLEEDWFLRLVAPAAPQRRTLSLDGARVLAGQLRDAVARRHALAIRAAAKARAACPFDLNVLLPIPGTVLRLGPDHPRSLAWLWEHWGTTQELRHVGTDAGPGSDQNPARADLHRLVFWSADWTPWRAFSTIRTQWPALRFDIQPVYDRL